MSYNYRLLSQTEIYHNHLYNQKSIYHTHPKLSNSSRTIIIISISLLSMHFFPLTPLLQYALQNSISAKHCLNKVSWKAALRWNSLQVKSSLSFGTELQHEQVSQELSLSFRLTEGSGVQIVLHCLIADLCAKYSAGPLNVNYVWQAGSQPYSLPSNQLPVISRTSSIYSHTYGYIYKAGLF